MVLLVRYGEIALKSRFVRRQLEDRLAANVRDMFAAGGVECIVKVGHGRLFVYADDEAGAVRLLRRVFGIVSVSPAREMSSDLDALAREVAAYASGLLKSGSSFAIRPRRSGTHPYTSQDLARVLGRAVQTAIPGVAVDLDEPDAEIHVEVRGPRAYLFHDVVDGPGGLPLGSQGDVLAVVDDEAGMAAAWMLMRRGCRVRVAGGGPFVEALRAWDPKLEISDQGDAAALAGESRTLAVVTARDADLGEKDLLVLRPLVGLTSAEQRKLAERIRTA